MTSSQQENMAISEQERTSQLPRESTTVTDPSENFTEEIRDDQRIAKDAHGMQTLQITEPGTLVRVDTGGIFLQSLDIAERGNKVRIALYNGHPKDFPGALIAGIMPIKSGVTRTLKHNAYRGLFYSVDVADGGTMGDYTLTYFV